MSAAVKTVMNKSEIRLQRIRALPTTPSSILEDEEMVEDGDGSINQLFGALISLLQNHNIPACMRHAAQSQVDDEQIKTGQVYPRPGGVLSGGHHDNLWVRLLPPGLHIRGSPGVRALRLDRQATRAIYKAKSPQEGAGAEDRGGAGVYGVPHHCPLAQLLRGPSEFFLKYVLLTPLSPTSPQPLHLSTTSKLCKYSPVI
eukprot:CAMPEP_0173226642 /NCGR_PEP_ID=MMETSP1142-20121109/5543_1 /TAXON_ID=483371 /ORGANISM="non described non described, Strain CCMP2298" /LENGTH=199 /DNA_ID=CAMNT_0014155113 /DNA_START=187 /DNA_END=787 /DNA_ORIENTATION=-